MSTTSSSTTATRPTDPPPGAEHLIRQLYGFGNVRRALAKAAHGELATPGFGALGALYRLGPVRVSDLATELQVDLSVASRQIAALVGASYIDRRPDPDDGRAQLLHLTDAGRSALSRAHHEMVATLGDALADWSPDEVDTLAAGIERLVDAFTRLPSDPEVSA